MVHLDKATKKFQDFQLEVSLELPEGRISGLVGKNGAGKSTTIKMILGMLEPDEGKAEVFGEKASQMSMAQKADIGVALAEAGFCSVFTITDIIKILKKTYKEFDENEFRTLCEKMHLPLEKRLSEFSTGMKAKVRVLVALSHKAKLLILDEPTAGLDVEARNEILDFIRSYLAEDENRSMLITSHISGDLENLCDDIYLIHDGKIILHEETDVVLQNYGILKLNEKQYEQVEKKYILKSKKENYGYACITGEKQFFRENYPEIVIENGGIDDLILMMTGGKNQ